MLCKYCGNEMRYRSTQKRFVKFPSGKKIQIDIEVVTCCGHYKRILPEYLLPYKHYTKDVIEKVRNGKISSDDLEYEDYPCEMTMKRWKKQEPM